MIKLPKNKNSKFLKQMHFKKDAEKFAEILKYIDLETEYIKIGDLEYKINKGTKHSIQYNKADFELLNHQHEYTIILDNGELELSLQLYENTSNHYRLFCYTHFNGFSGMTFSINLTMEKESENIIYLTQKIKFSDQIPEISPENAKNIRRKKQIDLCNLLISYGFDITDNNDLILGIFDPLRGEFINITPKQFLYNFILVSLLKGHFQENKGYSLSFAKQTAMIETIKNTEKLSLPSKVDKRSKARNIPLSMRYKIFVRDGFKCVACGRMAKDGIVLHVDHIVPFSKGGLTELSNLQTLCNECNLGKSNNFDV